MNRVPVLAAVCLALAVAPSHGPHAAGQEITFKASDGVTIHGDLHLTDGARSDPILLLFHQGGGDARSEYGPLVGRLNDATF